MKLTGQLLKKNREEQNLSLAEVSMATKISPKILSSIEEGDLSSLPAKTFLRGFVRSYAAFLKMDLDQVLDSFQDEMGSTLAEPQIEAGTTDPSWTGGSSLPPMTDRSNISKALAIVGIVVLIVLIVSVRNLIQKYEQEAQVGSLPEDLPTLATPAQPLEPIPTAGEESEPESGETSPAPEAMAEAPPPPERPPMEEAETQPVEAQSPPPSPSPGETARGEPMEIIFEALDRVQISFRSPGRGVERIILEPDQVHTLRAQGVLAVELSDGGAVNVILNGRDLGVPGDLGRPKRLRFPN